MIVKNEELTIKRCINSVAGFVNKVVVVDTGSTDSTEAVLRAACEEHGLDLDLHHREWVDFGRNRTELMEIAYGSADWLLLLDADMELKWSERSLPTNCDSCLLWYDGSLRYAQKLLVRGDLRWRYVGVTHEYIECLDRLDIQGSLQDVTVIHHMDGGSRHEKTQRDLDLLERERQSDEDNPRTVFYLAQTLEDSGNLLGACVNYGIRSRMGGWEEERWLAQVRHARLLPHANGSPQEARSLLLAAWDARPWRSEPLYHYSALSRSEGAYNSSLMAAQYGKKIPTPKDDLLFVENWIYDWGLVFEESVSLWYCGHREESLALGRWLLGLDLPPNFREAVIRNLSYGNQRTYANKEMQHLQLGQAKE